MESVNLMIDHIEQMEHGTRLSRALGLWSCDELLTFCICVLLSTAAVCESLALPALP